MEFIADLINTDLTYEMQIRQIVPNGKTQGRLHYINDGANAPWKK